LLTKRDIEVLKFINIFGYSFNDVLGVLFWNTPETSKGRLRKLELAKLIRFKTTGLISPRRAVFLTEQAKTFLLDIGVEEINNKKDVAMHTIEHLILEQKTYYHLSKIGNVERTTVYKHHSKLNHIPDMIYNNKFFIEIEITQKSKNNYKALVSKASKEEDIKMVYIVKNKDFAVTLAKSLPKWSRLYFIDYDNLIYNIENIGKIKPYKQSDLILN
jgi:hypothetical protein